MTSNTVIDDAIVEHALDSVDNFKLALRVGACLDRIKHDPFEKFGNDLVDALEDLATSLGEDWIVTYDWGDAVFPTHRPLFLKRKSWECEGLGIERERYGTIFFGFNCFSNNAHKQYKEALFTHLSEIIPELKTRSSKAWYFYYLTLSSVLKTKYGQDFPRKIYSIQDALYFYDYKYSGKKDLITNIVQIYKDHALAADKFFSK